MSHGVNIRTDFLYNTALLTQCLADFHTGFFAGQAVEAGASIGNMAGGIHDGRHVQVVAGAHRVVIRIVRRGDFHRAGTKLHIDVIISDDLELEVIAEWVWQLLAHKIGIAFIVWVNGNGNVTQHGLYTGGGHDEVRFIIIKRAIANGNQLALDVLVDNLDIRDGGLQHRRPVDQTVSLVNHALIIKVLKNGLHSAREAIVQGETLARPIYGVTNGTHLVLDGATVLFFPLPDLVNELFALVVPALFALGLLELGLDLGLGGNAGVIGTRQPQGGVALHALAADNGINQRVVQSVAHMQLTGHIRRRQHDGIRLGLRMCVWGEVALFYPALIEVLFYGLRLPRLRQRISAVGTN